jgi:Berberine and berberine like
LILILVRGNFAIHPATSPEITTLARGYARQIRDILFQGSGLNKLRVYVNYASGDETVEQMYGDGWRIEKLRKLKKKYDPNGRFDFYNPIS